MSYSQNEEITTLAYKNITLFFITTKWLKWLYVRDR